MIPHSRPTVIPAMAEAAARVIASGQHAGDAERAALESELSACFALDHAIAVQSGSAALGLALRALGVPSGGWVIAPSYACAALLNAISEVGGRPLLADIDPVRLTVTASTARAACRREWVDPAEVAAAIVPHTLGIPAGLEGWDLPVPVLEDAAMAIGTSDAGRPVGAHGRVTITSFYATKFVSSGQGGAVLTDDPALAEEVRDRTIYDGREEWRPSGNLTLPDLAAAIVRPQLGVVDEWVTVRHGLADRYRAACDEAGTAVHPTTEGSNDYRFLLRLGDRTARDAAAESAASAGIEAKPPVFRPLHRYLGLADEKFPVTTEVWETGLSIPLHPSLTEEEVGTVLAWLGAGAHA